jgi:hypothetical protein
MSDTSGRTSQSAFAFYDPDSCSLRTSEITFDLGLTPSSLTLPVSGSMRSGRISEHGISARRTSETASGWLLPTPSASSYGTNRGGSAGRVGPWRPSLETLERACLPTPTLCGDWNRRGSSPTSGDGLSAVAGPSIRLREWMMGLPRDWLAVDESALARLPATRSSSRAPKRSDAPPSRRVA